MRQMERGTITEAHYLLYEQTYEKKYAGIFNAAYRRKRIMDSRIRLCRAYTGDGWNVFVHKEKEIAS